MTNKKTSPRPTIARQLLRGTGFAAILIVLLCSGGWCAMISMPGTSHQGALPPADEPLKALGEELRAEIQHLAGEIGERNVLNRPKELAKAADYIEVQFKAAGYEVKRQEYEVAGAKCCNLAAEIAGKTKPKEIVVIGAHYDTVVGTPGANDNTSGVAAVLVLARRFAKQAPERTLRFVAFVNEEPPYFQTDKMGSRVYAKQCRADRDNIVAMLSLETLGWYDDKPGSQQYPAPFDKFYPTTANFIGFIGNVASGNLVRQAIGAFRQNEAFPSEGAAVPDVIPGVGFSDHWSFWQEGYPAIMVTDTAMFRYRHYHQPEDTIDKIDFDRMSRVVRGLTTVVAELAGVKR